MAVEAYLSITRPQDTISYGCSITSPRRATSVDHNAGRADNRRGRVEKARLGVDKYGKGVAAGLPGRGANGKRPEAEFHKM
jgi:hypothetical protein